MVDSSATVRFSIIRGNIKIGPKASIYRCDIYGNTVIGEAASLTGPGLYIHSVEKTVTIKSFVSIAPGAKIITSGHDLKASSTSFSAGGKRTESNIDIGSHCWIGAGAIVTEGSRFDDYCVVASGGVAVGKHYGGRIIWGGVPLRKIGDYHAG